MDKQIFSHVFCDYYVRRYELNPKICMGSKVTVYAECHPNTTDIDKGYYNLEIYFSADEFTSRGCLFWTTFGKKQMTKKEIDAEVDGWVEHFVSSDSLAHELRDYIIKEQVWEDYLDSQLSDDNNDAE